MQQNNLNNVYPCAGNNQPIPNGASAVSINIIAPQAYGANTVQGNTQQNPIQQGGGYIYNQPYNPIYNYAQSANPYYYPINYNNIVQNPIQYNNQYPQYPPYPQYMNNQQGVQNQPIAPQAQPQYDTPQGVPYNPQGQTQGAGNQRGALDETNLFSKTKNEEVKDNTEEKTEKKEDKKEEPKKITPLTDDYIKSLENYLNNSNPKIRLIGAKELLERFKEDENRKDNPSLIPLLNKVLQDSSSAVRFLGLTTLQLGYSLGNDETVKILQQIQSQNLDKFGEDSLLASEILLQMVSPKQEVNKS